MSLREFRAILNGINPLYKQVFMLSLYIAIMFMYGNIYMVIFEV